MQETNIIETLDLDELPEDEIDFRKQLEIACDKLYRREYRSEDRLIFRITKDFYRKGNPAGYRLQTLQRVINARDISNFFVVVETTNPVISEELTYLQGFVSSDPIPIKHQLVPGQWHRRTITSTDNFRNYQYGSTAPSHIGLSELTERQKFLLTESKTFCIYPWIHLHAYPTGEAWPCCYADMAAGPAGNCQKQSLKEIWNSDRIRELRRTTLQEQEHPWCRRCYEQEKSGFFSGRQSANKHQGHLVHKVDHTEPDGTYDNFQMTYWDIRFSNLCNLRCRSCGHIFSSQWYQDQAKIAGPKWKETHQVLNYAGRTETDMWEQLIEHIDYVEQIYFAGGEPLLMAEHYNILDELDRRGRFDVRLVYNTNFTEIRLKDRTVFDYWKKFDSVSVGASLDAMGPRAEYIRKGTVWDQVERNRELMLRQCPEVDFYISSTYSILNALHLPDFHKIWVEKGLIRAQDCNVNILQDPKPYRIDVAPESFKSKIHDKVEQHLDWLRPIDRLQRATRGYESAMKFMMSTDNQYLLPQFREKIAQLDAIRGESLLDVIPELRELYDENTTR